MSLEIRLATIEDVPAITELIGESVRALGAGYYSPKQIASALSHVFGVDTQLILDETYFVAEVENQIVGSGGWSKRKTLFGGDQLKFGGGQSKQGQIDSLLDSATEAARIRAFYVHPHWSRRGVGSRILTVCENAARAAGVSRIELVATLPGEPLYSSRGYEKAEAIQIDTADGESLPAFRMTKTFI